MGWVKTKQIFTGFSNSKYKPTPHQVVRLPSLRLFTILNPFFLLGNFFSLLSGGTQGRFPPTVTLWAAAGTTMTFRGQSARLLHLRQWPGQWVPSPRLSKQKVFHDQLSSRAS
jgi:hypothetical protein